MLPIFVTNVDIIIDFKFEELENALSEIFVIAFDKFIVALFISPNEFIPLLITNCGIVILVKSVHPKNNELPILVTLSGIIIDVSLEQ